MARKKSIQDINAQLARIKALEDSIKKSAQNRGNSWRADQAEKDKQSARYLAASRQGTRAEDIAERYKRNIDKNYWFSPKTDYYRKYSQNRYVNGVTG